MESNEIRRQTVLHTYGVDNIAKLPEIQARRAATYDRKRVILSYEKPAIHHTVDGYALQLYRLNKDVANSWLDQYHPLKHCPGTAIALGLVKDDIIYCMMTFKKSRNKRYVAELSRMWMLPEYHVIGGYARLSQEASNFGIYNIVAYVNVLFEDVKDYKAIGMKYVSDIQRTKWWVKGRDMISDASRRQAKKSKQDMLDAGYESKYDCGQKVYVYT